MNQISLTCGPHSNTGIFVMHVRGLTSAQVNRYASMCGFMVFEQPDSVPLIVGHVAQKESFLCLLESAGYELEIVPTEVGQ